MTGGEAPIERLAKLAERLNHETDELNRAITELEDKLKSMNLGIVAWVPSEISDAAEVPFSVGYMKLDDEWHIVIERDEAKEMTPLIKTNRKTRVTATRVLDNLVEALIESAQEILNGTETARKNVEYK